MSDPKESKEEQLGLGVQSLIRELEDDVLRIKKRFYYLEKFLGRVKEVTGERPFRIRNDIVWQTIVDSYEMLIIDFASLIRGMCQEGGFFGQLKQHCAELRVRSYRKFKATEPCIAENPRNPMTDEQRKNLVKYVMLDEQKMYARIAEEAFDFLFPSAKGAEERRANHDLIDELKNDFMKVAEEVVKDRDSFRAHRYEKSREHRELGREDKLTLDRLKHHFDHVEETLTKIRLLATNSSFAFSDMNGCDGDETAADLVDIVMLGSMNRIFNAYKIPNQLKRIESVPPYFYITESNFMRRIKHPLD